MGFLILIVGIPIGFIIYLSLRRKIDNNGVLEENKKTYADMLEKGDYEILDFLKLIAEAKEFQSIKIIDQSGLEKLEGLLIEKVDGIDEKEK